ncbi:MAG: sulfite exporter TauE/SafE family protein [Acidobacteriota bacterium]
MHVTAFDVKFLAVVFVATLIRSTFGFGEALIAVPLLALMLPIKIAAPVVVLLSVTIAVVVIVQDWRHVHVRSTGWLLAPGAIGVPLGVLLLTHAHEAVVKCVLGVLLILFAGYFLLGRNPAQLKSDSKPWLLGCGLVSGVLGGAYGMNGPALVVYGAMRRWSPQHFRATLQGVFFPASLLVMAGYWASGLWVPAVTHYYLLSLPAALPAIVLGGALNRRLRGDTFLRYVYAGLVCMGIALLVQAVRGK